MDCPNELEGPVTYTWNKQGDVLPQESSMSKEGLLTLTNVKGQDAGTYICSVRNQYATLDVMTILVVTNVVPQFQQNPLSYMKKPTLSDAYMQFEIELSLKPEGPDGLILYNGQSPQGGDFISLGLSYGSVEFRYELGDGIVLLKSRSPIEIGKWHTIKIKRDGKRGFLKVDNEAEVSGVSPGRYVGLTLTQDLYLGGIPDFNQISKLNGFRRGFDGCLSLFKINGIVQELFNDGETYAVGHCDTCLPSPCLNSGVCQEAIMSPTGYKCICPPGFSGNDCEKVSETCQLTTCNEGRCINRPSGGFDCYCPIGKSGNRCEKQIVVIEPSFSENSYITYQTPKDSLMKLNLKMKLKPRKVQDALLMYSAQNYDGQGDFISLAIKNQSIEFRFNTGSGPGILTSHEKLEPEKWINVIVHRTANKGELRVGNSLVLGETPGTTKGLNLRIPLYVGGYDKQRLSLSSFTGVNQGFDGCIGHVSLSF